MYARLDLLRNKEPAHKLKIAITGAGLDVFEEEPISPEDALLELDNTVLAPHIGSAALETRQKMAQIVCSDVEHVLKGRSPKYLLNPEVTKVRPLE